MTVTKKEEMSARQGVLLDFVKSMHGNQKRKYTDEPYWHHVLNVGMLASTSEMAYTFEIGLCHDLIEDTPCTLGQLLDALLSGGYELWQAQAIVVAVHELTDVYVNQGRYKKWNRAKRKAMEALRLSNVGYVAQTVKYADIIDNAGSICEHDPKFGEVYLREISQLLAVMDKGHDGLYGRAKAIVWHYDNNLFTLLK